MSFWCHRLDQNSNENILRISALKVFIASLGLPGSFLGFPVGFLIYDITNTKSPGSPKNLPESPQEATKNFGAEILTIFSLTFCKIDKFILSLTDL